MLAMSVLKRGLASPHVQRVSSPAVFGVQFQALFSITASSIQKHQQPQGKATTLSSVHAPPPQPPLSRRRQFKQIPVDIKLLQFIRDQKVCKPMRQARTRKLNRLIGNADNKRNKGPPPPTNQRPTKNRPAAPLPPPPPPPPPPFGGDKPIVRVRQRIQASDDNVKDALENLNPQRIPIVALCGRSNVGKSTLLNALLYGNRRSNENNDLPKQKAKTGGRHNRPIPLPKGAKAVMSPTPGETKDITFYELSSSHVTRTVATSTAKATSTATATTTATATATATTTENQSKKRLWLADLPGYGFAHASPVMAAAYQNLMATYLSHKKQRPQRLLLLLDARHGFKQTDRIFLQDLQKQCNYHLPPLQVVLTKCDLVEAVELARRVSAVEQDVSDTLHRQSGSLPILLTSASKRYGILSVQKELASLVRG